MFQPCPPLPHSDTAAASKLMVPPCRCRSTEPRLETPISQNSPSRWQHWVDRLQTIPIVTDFQIIFERDPAAHNWLEVLCCYPGFHALTCHRFAHWLRGLGVPFFPRFISHLARFLTGVEIHPGAQIGRGVFIDHGMGVVIGETAIVGNYCLIYQGVTLGGTGKETGKRHPTLGQQVVVGAGAKILGNIQIGDRARIGAGSIVLRHVPSGCTAVGVPGRNICRNRDENCPLDHDKLPDAEASVIRMLVDRIEQLERKIATLQAPLEQR
ncbi:MAG: serine O-acetyltransferase [Leptolyngbyaceae cyanobacterium bins.59]|nr:serine O-acetyltransferase [Leptolyngbyaceae cyanobacterium bins.59]